MSRFRSPFFSLSFGLILAAAPVACDEDGSDAPDAGTTEVDASADTATEVNADDKAWESAVESLYEGSSPFGLGVVPPDILDWEGERLQRWMMPYLMSSEREAAASDFAERLLAVGDDGGTTLLHSSFEESYWDEFFRGRLAKYMGDLMSDSLYGEDFFDAMVARPCWIIIDAFGELTTDNEPSWNGRVSAGVTNGQEMEVVTTYPVWMITHDQEGVGADLPVPVWLLPLYERYLIQHELGHMVDFNLGDTVELDQEPLSEHIDRLYLEAERDHLHTSCYGSDDEMEYWAEATALYLAPLPIVSLNSSLTDPSCGVGLTAAAEALVLENGFLRLTGAELIELMQPDLHTLLGQVYGDPPDFSLREDRDADARRR